MLHLIQTLSDTNVQRELKTKPTDTLPGLCSNITLYWTLKNSCPETCPDLGPTFNPTICNVELSKDKGWKPQETLCSPKPESPAKGILVIQDT